MMKSMTGFGKSTCKLLDNEIYIEIRSLNSKQAEINLRSSSKYKSKELEIKKKIIEFLERGKIDITLTDERLETNNSNKINESVFKSYYLQLKKITDELQINSNNIANVIMNLPNIIDTEKKREINDRTWKNIMNSIIDALKEVDNFRLQEGKALEHELNNRITEIKNLLQQVSLLDPSRITKIKKILLSRVKNFQSDPFDKNRFEQELIYYIEKLDITEEKVRLANHCNYFLETIASAETLKGKKLNFISQEIGREINTIGSKANDDKIQKLVVEMKDTLEKIKEQCFNVL